METKKRPVNARNNILPPTDAQKAPRADHAARHVDSSTARRGRGAPTETVKTHRVGEGAERKGLRGRQLAVLPGQSGDKKPTPKRPQNDPEMTPKRPRTDPF